MVKMMESKVQELLGCQNEMVVLVGKVYDLEEQIKTGTGEVYYRFKVKVMRQTDDVYSVSFNTYLCFMPAAVADKHIKIMEDIEGKESVIMARPSCRVKKVKWQEKTFEVNDRFQLFIERVIQNDE